MITSSVLVASAVRGPVGAPLRSAFTGMHKQVTALHKPLTSLHKTFVRMHEQLFRLDAGIAGTNKQLSSAKEHLADCHRGWPALPQPDCPIRRADNREEVLARECA